MKLWTVVKGLFLVIASFYGVEAGLNLMNFRSDVSFWGGVFVLAFLLFVWVELGIKSYHKVKEWMNEMP